MLSSQTVHGPWYPTSAPNLDLLSQIVCIFSMLSEVLEIGGPELVRATDYAELTQCLSFLVTMDDMIHPGDMQASGLLAALKEIIAMQSKWPFAVRSKAKILMNLLEERFGGSFLQGGAHTNTSDARVGIFRVPSLHGSSNTHPLTFSATELPKAHRILDFPKPGKAVRPHLTAEQVKGGTMSVRMPSLVRSYAIRWTPGHSIGEQIKLPAIPLHPGTLIFHVGDWWPTPVAAANDRIVKWRPKLSQAPLYGTCTSLTRKNIFDNALAKSTSLMPSTPDQRSQKATSEPEIRSYIDMTQNSIAHQDAFLDRPQSERECWEAAAITADEFGAYALLLSGLLELPLDKISMLDFQANPTDPNRKSLMKNLRTQDPIRVLRSRHQSDARCKDVGFVGRVVLPRAGVRYDGLYRVMKYSVRLDNRLWQYRYILRRCPNQKTLGEIMNIPTDRMLQKARKNIEETNGKQERIQLKDKLER